MKTILISTNAKSILMQIKFHNAFQTNDTNIVTIIFLQTFWVSLKINQHHRKPFQIDQNINLTL